MRALLLALALLIGCSLFAGLAAAAPIAPLVPVASLSSTPSPSPAPAPGIYDPYLGQGDLRTKAVPVCCCSFGICEDGTPGNVCWTNNHCRCGPTGNGCFFYP